MLQEWIAEWFSAISKLAIGLDTLSLSQIVFGSCVQYNALFFFVSLGFDSDNL